MTQVNLQLDAYDKIEGDYPNGYVLTVDENAPNGVSFQEASGCGGNVEITDTILNLGLNSGAMNTEIIGNVNSNDSIETKFFNVKSNYANSFDMYNTSINTYYFGSGAVSIQPFNPYPTTKEDKFIYAKNRNTLRCGSQNGDFGDISSFTNGNSSFDAINYDFYQNSSFYLEQDFFIKQDGYEDSVGLFCGIYSGVTNDMFQTSNQNSILNLNDLINMPTYTRFFGIGAFPTDTNLQVLIGKTNGTLQKVELPFNKNGKYDVNGILDGDTGYFRIKTVANNDHVKIQVIRITTNGVVSDNFIEIDLLGNSIVKEALSNDNGITPPVISFTLAPTLSVFTNNSTPKEISFSKMFYEKGSQSSIKKHFIEMSADEKVFFPNQYIVVGNGV